MWAGAVYQYICGPKTPAFALRVAKQGSKNMLVYVIKFFALRRTFAGFFSCGRATL